MKLTCFLDCYMGRSQRNLKKYGESFRGSLLISTSFEAYWAIYLNGGDSFSIFVSSSDSPWCIPSSFSWNMLSPWSVRYVMVPLIPTKQKFCHKKHMSRPSGQKNLMSTKDLRIKDFSCLGTLIFGRYHHVPRHYDYIYKQFTSIIEIDSMSLSLREQQREAYRGRQGERKKE